MSDLVAGSLTGARIAVTGASGFIGRVLVSRLLEDGAEVVALVRGPDSKDSPPNRKLSRRKLELEQFDWTDHDFEGVDSICHLAAYIPKNRDDPSEAEKCLRINALGTLNLLRAAERAEVEYFLNISAGQVYAYKDSIADEESPVDTSGRATFYLTSKLLGEFYVDHFRRSRGMNTVSLRLGSVYGPGALSQPTVCRLIEKMLDGSVIQIVNEGKFRVDLVYVEDVVSAIASALKGHASGTYNIGSGKATSLTELINEIQRQCSRDSSPIEHISGPEDLGFAPLDIDKARRDLGYEPLALEEGLARTIAAIMAKRVCVSSKT